MKEKTVGSFLKLLYTVKNKKRLMCNDAGWVGGACFPGKSFDSVFYGLFQGLSSVLSTLV